MISPVIITANEQEVLPFTLECLLPIKALLSEVVIVDDFSTDRTTQIADRYSQLMPVKLIQRKFDTFRGQKNFAIEQATGKWILALDADMAFNTLTFGNKFMAGFFDHKTVWDFALLFSRGDLKNYCQASSSSMGTTRFFKNIGLRYERDVHEYLVMPGETGWDSIHNSRVIEATGDVVILETSMLKSDKAVRERVARYQRWSEKSGEAGINISNMAAGAEELIRNRWENAVPVPPRVLAGIPSTLFHMAIPYQYVH